MGSFLIGAAVKVDGRHRAYPIDLASSPRLGLLPCAQPITKIEGHVRLPGSKSLSNRILLLAALSSGTTTVENILDSDDIRYMVGALKSLGVGLEEDWPNRRIVVKGCGGRFPSTGGDLFLGNAGTAMRPLCAAVAAAGRGRFVLDGIQRMRERPIQDLVDGLVQLGVKATCTLGTGCPPVEVVAEGLKGGKVYLKGSVSSQYLTALLMAAPLCVDADGIEIIISDTLVSEPYVDMTVKLMERQVPRDTGQVYPCRLDPLTPLPSGSVSRSSGSTA